MRKRRASPPPSNPVKHATESEHSASASNMADGSEEGGQLHKRRQLRKVVLGVCVMEKKVARDKFRDLMMLVSVAVFRSRLPGVCVVLLDFLEGGQQRDVAHRGVLDCTA